MWMTTFLYFIWYQRTPIMAVCCHESGNMGSNMCHAARVCLVIDDAFACYQMLAASILFCSGVLCSI